MRQADWIVSNASRVVTARGPGPVCGTEMSRLVERRRCSIAIAQGRIAAVAPAREISRGWRGKILDARGCLVTPGLVDAHTHLIFAGSRADEFELRARGATYQEIAQGGGGIWSTVRETRRAAEAELLEVASRRFARMLRQGTTRVEVKSGYGLERESELKLLRAARKIGVPTFLGAHAIPPGMRADRYVREVLAMLPAAAELARFCDVFCEPGWFSVRQTERILRTARMFGMQLKIHAEEFVRSGGALLAAQLGATSADHLVAATRQDIRAMAAAGVIGVLLPTTSLFAGGGRFAPARAMIDAGMAVALGSDFNPGTGMGANLPLAMHLGCSRLRMTPAEVLTAATVNAARAIGLDTGVIETGFPADLVVWELEDPREIAYHMGLHPIRAVFRGGRLFRTGAA